MANKLEPDVLEPIPQESEEEARGLSRTLGLYSSTFRRTPPRPGKERIEAEEIIKSLTSRDDKLAKGDLTRLVTWHLAALANFALLILLLYGLGMVKLPTPLVVAVVGPLLSGVLGLLGVLVKHLTR